MIVVLVLLSWLCIQARSRAGGSIFGRANSDGFVTTVRGRGMERLFEPRLLLMVRVAFQLISRNCFSTEMFVSQVTALKAQEIYMQELQEKGSMGSGGQSSILPSINRVVSQKIPILLKIFLSQTSILYQVTSKCLTGSYAMVFGTATMKLSLQSSTAFKNHWLVTLVLSKKVGNAELRSARKTYCWCGDFGTHLSIKGSKDITKDT